MKNVKNHEPQVKHHETLDYSPFDVTISALNEVTSALSAASLVPGVEFPAIYAIAELV